MNHPITQQLLEGSMVREPIGEGKGYWVGAPGWRWDETDQAAYLTYRIRRPHGVEPDRGGESRIAKTTDFTTFEDIWSVQKNQYDSSSIEKSNLMRGDDGLWRYVTSYVDPKDDRWCVAINRAETPSTLDVSQTQRLFTASELGLEGVKDPVLFEEDGIYNLFLSVAMGTTTTNEESHSSQDIFNTGQCISATALATSKDLDDWEWQGVVLRPEGEGWDKYCRRINSVLRLGEKYYAFYDGSSGHHENYEERTGLAISNDLLNWETLTPDGPCIVSPHATGSLRYVDAQKVGDEIISIHELTRPCGAHEMRLTRFPADGFSLA